MSFGLLTVDVQTFGNSAARRIIKGDISVFREAFLDGVEPVLARASQLHKQSIESKLPLGAYTGQILESATYFVSTNFNENIGTYGYVGFVPQNGEDTQYIRAPWNYIPAWELGSKGQMKPPLYRVAAWGEANLPGFQAWWNVPKTPRRSRGSVGQHGLTPRQQAFRRAKALQRHLTLPRPAHNSLEAIQKNAISLLSDWSDEALRQVTGG